MREFMIIMFAAMLLGCSGESASGSTDGEPSKIGGSAKFSVKGSAGGGFDQDSDQRSHDAV